MEVLDNQGYWEGWLNSLVNERGLNLSDFRKYRLLYTLRHKEAVVLVYNQLTGCLPSENSRLYYHDNDKVALYLLTDLEKKEVSALHRKYSLHHKENWRKVLSSELFYKNVEEAMLDYESARLTKADKPYNAYESMLGRSVEYQCREADEILSNWGIASEERKSYNYSCYNTIKGLVRESVCKALLNTLYEYNNLLAIYDVYEAERLYLSKAVECWNWE